MKHALADPEGAWPMQIRQLKTSLLGPRRPEDVSPHPTKGQQQPLRPDVDPTLNVSGISAPADSKGDEDHQPQAKQTSRYLATPIAEDDHFSQDD